MKKGIVLDIGKKHITVLTPDGEFCKAVKTKPYEIGQEIHFTPLTIETTTQWTFPSVSKKYQAVAAGFVAILLLLASFWPFGTGNVYAYVSMDFNPSVEFGIDKNLKVVEIFTYDKEAERILAQMNRWKGKPIDVVTTTFITESQKQGYLNEGSQVLVSTTILNEEDNLNIKQDIESTFEKVKDQKNIQVSTFASTKEVREQALETGNSPGKYLIYTAAKERDVELDINTIKEKSIGELAKEFGGLGKLLGNVSDENDSEDLTSPEVGQNIKDSVKEERKELKEQEKDLKESLKDEIKQLRDEEKDQKKELKEEIKNLIKDNKGRSDVNQQRPEENDDTEEKRGNSNRGNGKDKENDKENDEENDEENDKDNLNNNIDREREDKEREDKERDNRDRGNDKAKEAKEERDNRGRDQNQEREDRGSREESTGDMHFPSIFMLELIR